MITRRTQRTSYAAASVALGALLFAGCGESDDAPAGATKLSYKLTDAGCDPAQNSAPAGPVTFERHERRRRRRHRARGPRRELFA